MSHSLLSVRKLSTWFESGRGRLHAVDEISFDIARGETFALLGESGSGKSLTALSIMRLLPATAGVSGEVWLEGQDLLALPERDMRSVRGGRIAMIFQEPMTSLNAVLPVGVQISEALRCHHGITARAAQTRAIELLDAVGIAEPQRRYHDFPHQLSGGMKQRVMIAIALAGEPELLIADEPTTALDVTIQAQILELLRKLQKDTGMALLLITHDLGVVSEMAARVAVMYAGQMVEQASRTDLFAEPRHPYTQKLFESVPTLGKRGTRLAVIQGRVPPLTQVFTGCRFAPRCEFAWQTCHERTPELLTVRSHTAVRCHLHDARYQASAPAQPTRPEPLAEQTTATAVGEELLTVSDLKVYFPIEQGIFKRVVGYVRAVDGVSLSICAGRTLALVGESGSGKTTVGKSILQLLRPTAGSVRFSGTELTQLRGAKLRARRADFQIIFQDPYSSLNPRMIVADIIEEGMVAQGVGKSAQERTARIAQVLEQVGLSAETGQRYPHEFSGGQRQRISIARALAVRPKLLVCDEPTSALDVSVQAQTLNLLKELQRELGIAYLFITHNIAVVEYLADEVAVMHQGKIVEQGSAAEVLRNAQHPYTKTLLQAVPKIAG